MTTQKTDLETSPEDMNRRNLLIAGTTLTAATLAGGLTSAFCSKGE